MGAARAYLLGHGNPLAIDEGQHLVVVHDRVHALDPQRVHGAVKEDPLLVRFLVWAKRNVKNSGVHNADSCLPGCSRKDLRTVNSLPSFVYLTRKPQYITKWVEEKWPLLESWKSHSQSSTWWLTA